MYSTKHSKFFKNMVLFVGTVLATLGVGTLFTYAEDEALPMTETGIIEEILLQEPTFTAPDVTEVENSFYTQIPSPVIPDIEIPQSEEVGEQGEDINTEPLPEVPMMLAEVSSFTLEEPGTITILLDALPNNAQNFAFTNNFGNGNPAAFQLDDDSNAALLNTATFSVIPGTYVLSQDAVAGWKLSSATCSNGSPITAISVASGEQVGCTFVNKKLGTITLVKKTLGGEGTFDFTMTGTSLPQHAQLATQNASATLVFTNIDPESTYSIAENQKNGWELTSASCTRGTPDNFNLIATNLNVTCTFTNTYTVVPGEIRLIKETIPDGALDTFQFVGDIQNSIHDGDVPLSTHVEPGTYTTTEEKVTGWTMSAVDCDDTDSVGKTDTGSVTYNVGSGEVVTCAVTNVKDPSIAILGTGVNQIKEPHTFTVTLGQYTRDAFTPVTPGTPVTVTISPSGYELVEDTCSTTGTQNGVCTVTINSNIPLVYTAHAEASVNIGGISYIVKTDGKAENSGDATKTYEAGKIIVQKVTEGGLATFTFNASYNADGIVLQGGESNDSGYVPLGTYSVSENMLDGWYQKSATCDNGDSPTNITLNENGEIVTCTFVNELVPVVSPYAQLTIGLDAQPNDTKNFAFLLFHNASATQFLLDDDAGVRHGDARLSNTKVLHDVSAGTVAIAELNAWGKWKLENVSCTRDGNSSIIPVVRYGNLVTLELAKGDAVTCVFTNTKESHHHRKESEKKHK